MCMYVENSTTVTPSRVSITRSPLSVCLSAAAVLILGHKNQLLLWVPTHRPPAMAHPCKFYSVRKKSPFFLLQGKVIYQPLIPRKCCTFKKQFNIELHFCVQKLVCANFFFLYSRVVKMETR